MKKGLLSTLFILFALTNMNAQTSVGAGVLLGNGATAIEAKANFGVSDQISISPSFDYFLLGDSYDSLYGSDINISIYMFGVDGHYNFGDPDALNYYPLAGLNYFAVSYSGNGVSGNVGSGIGLTVGGGATYALSESMKLYGEVKYIRSGLGLSAGLLFSF